LEERREDRHMRLHDFFLGPVAAEGLADAARTLGRQADEALRHGFPLLRLLLLRNQVPRLLVGFPLRTLVIALAFELGDPGDVIGLRLWGLVGGGGVLVVCHVFTSGARRDPATSRGGPRRAWRVVQPRRRRGDSSHATRVVARWRGGSGAGVPRPGRDVSSRRRAASRRRPARRRCAPARTRSAVGGSWSPSTRR